MKRFLDNKIVIAQFGGVSTPIFDPQSPEGQIGKGIDKMSDPEKAAIIDEAVKKYDNIISNERSSKSIFTANGNTDADYNSEVSAALSRNITKLQFDNLIISLWPKMQEKNFTFSNFIVIFRKAADRFRGASGLESFFDNFFKVLPDLSKLLATSDEIISKAMDFLSSGKSADEFQQYLLYQMIRSYALFHKIPENKQADIIKATEQLETLRSDVSMQEQELRNYLNVKAQFLEQHRLYFIQVTEALMDIRKNNFINLIGLMRNGIDENRIQFYFKNLKKGDFNALLTGAQPYLPRDVDNGNAGSQGNARGGHFSDKLRRKVFASGDNRGDLNRVTNTPYTPVTGGPLTEPRTPTQSGAFSGLYGKFTKEISEFESTILTLSKQVDNEINYIVTKQSTSPQIGPFSAGNVFQYLQDEEKSLSESERIIELISKLINFASNLKNDLKQEINKTSVSQPEEKDKEFTKTALDETFDLFEKDMRSKQLGLKFNKVLISRQNEYSEAQDLYDDLKTEMENNVSARPVMAPKAVLAGFRMADILEEIAEEFKAIAGNNPLRAEQAMKTARRWENFAKQQRSTVFTEIYPGMAQSIGIEATKPSISPSFSLRGAFVDIARNLRLAGKFMDKEVESDKKFRDYWNNLFMQSKDPRPMGDIIEEKPKHGNLTTEEDAKLHKKTMRKFKKPATKSRFKKN
jgi:hypothetical protein